MASNMHRIYANNKSCLKQDSYFSILSTERALLMPARCFEEPIKNDALENIVTSASSLFYEWLFLVQIRDKIREIRNIYN